MGYNSDLLRHKVVVFWRFTYILSVTNKFSKHDSLQVIKFYVLLFDVQLICSEYGSKHDLRQVKAFVYLRSALSLPVLNMDWKHD